MPQTMIKRISDRYGESWLVYVHDDRRAWVLYLCSMTKQTAQNAARRARRELRRKAV